MFQITRSLTAAVLTAGLALAVSCSDRQTSVNGGLPGDEPREIGFRSAGEKTRAQETDGATIADFRVSAVWARDIANNDYEPAYMNEVKVERSSGSWTYDPVRYWPSAGTVGFFAYSPAASGGVTSFAVTGAAWDGAEIGYTATTDHRMQEDFLVASALGQTSSPVLMNFRHALSQVEFRARSGAPGVSFRIRGIELLNLDRQGTLSGAVAAPGDTELTWTWSDNTAASEKIETYPVYMPSAFTVTHPGDSAAAPDFVSVTDASVGNLMILPQAVTIGACDYYTQEDIDADENDAITHGMLGQPKDMDTGFYIAVTFDSETVYYPGTGAIPFHSNTTIYIPLYVSLAPAVPFEFEMGRKYTFMLELSGLDMVRFTVSETGWSTEIVVPVSGLPEA